MDKLERMMDKENFPKIVKMISEIGGGADKNIKELSTAYSEILTMFMFQKEMTIDDMVEQYIKWKTKVSYSAVNSYVQDMVNYGILQRQRRKVKKYIEGHAKTVSTFYYWVADTYFIDLMKKARELAMEELGNDNVPDLEFVPSVMKDRMAFKQPKEVEPVITPDEPVITQEDTVQFNFTDALQKIYAGKKVVSAVSGNVYAMMDDEKKKGITCSSDPGRIVGFFPQIEMDGLWREIESPKTCPYCGSPMKLVSFENEKIFYYECTDNKQCRSRSPVSITPEEAVVKLNRRVVE